IKIFEQVLKYNPNSFLLIAGDGPLMNDISKVINDSSFSNKIRLLGNIDNVSDMMNSCDVVVMPSLYEGLPIVAIEAQCNGLPVVFSNTISEEAVLSNNCARIGLEESDDCWAKLILEMKAENRSDAFNIVNDKGYNIEKVTKQLENIII
ncbi:MAG: glycosyltransferase, partial [Clostridia bacterium]